MLNKSLTTNNNNNIRNEALTTNNNNNILNEALTTNNIANNNITNNAITQNAVPQQLMNKTLANTVSNDIKIEVKTDDPMTAGTSVKNSLEQQLKDTNSTINKGGY